jgi:hypothetical protein
MKKLLQKMSMSTASAAVAGVTALLIVLIYFLFQNQITETAIFTQFESEIRIVWIGMLAIGGFCCLGGVFSENDKLIGGGLSLLGSAYIIDAIGLLSKGYGGLLTGSLIAATGIRLWVQSAGLYVANPKVPQVAHDVMERYYREKVSESDDTCQR